ncbi:hypothetical protein IGI80_000321 [Enterococcus sp. DIV1420a]
MSYSRVKRLYEVFNFENRTFRDFCWHLYENRVITISECAKFIRMEEAND